MSKKHYNTLAKRLKKLKLINFDLRKELTSSQKAAITRQAKKHAALLENEKYIRVVKRPKGVNKKLNDLGIKTHGNFAYVNIKGGFDKVRLTKDKIIKTSPFKREEIFIEKPQNYLDILERESTLARAPNQRLMVKIGDSSPWKKRFRNMNQLMKYLETWTPRDTENIKGVKKQERFRKELISEISLVTVQH